VSPVSAPEISLRCSTPKSAIRIGSSRYDRILTNHVKTLTTGTANEEMDGHEVPVSEHEAVRRAVHGFQSELAVLHVKYEHILLIMSGVPSEQQTTTTPQTTPSGNDCIVYTYPLIFHKSKLNILGVITSSYPLYAYTNTGRVR
jgi:hypothetical protein